MFKALDMVGLSWLTQDLRRLKRLGTVPVEWQTKVEVPIFKKGYQRVCSNYWDITLISFPGKVYYRMLGSGL